MITKQVIDSLYKKYQKMPKNDADRNLHVIREFASVHPAMDIEGDNLTLYNVDPTSPFSEINLKNVNACVEFDDCLALVMHSSIVFIMKADGAPHVHIKMQPESLADKFRFWFAQ